jgi:hypothetical protein
MCEGLEVASCIFNLNENVSGYFHILATSLHVCVCVCVCECARMRACGEGDSLQYILDRSWMGPTVGLDTVEGKKFLSLPGIYLKFP